MASSSSSKPTNFNQKLFIISLFLISFSLLIIVFSFKPQPTHFPDSPSLQTEPLPLTNKPKWLELIREHVAGQKIKVGLVNVNNYIHDVHGTSAETVHIHFDRVPDDKRWGDFFPEWIDEDHKWQTPSCPEIPMPRLEEYRDLDVIVARVPCGGGDEKEGIRDVFRLQVNLVVANLAVESGRVNPDSDRTVYVVFVGSCGPMIEIFRCDDMVMHVGDYWVYKPELRRLKQKVIMPVGSCQISPGYAETGKEEWRYFLQTKLNYTAHYETEAYVTVLHSSEGYVCGAIALAQSIIQSNTKRDLVLLHDKSLSDKSIRGLRAAGWKTKLISRIRSPFSVKDSYNEWNYSKLRVWQLIEYEKVIFIDADLLVLRNIDKFFFYPQLSAAGNDGSLFNSGIMVIEPSLCMFEKLMVKSFKVASYNGGDQGFLNEIFTWWHRLPSKINHLKVFRTLDNKDGNNDEHRIPENLYAIHYLGLKPWLCYKEYDCNWDMVDHHIFASDSAHKKWWRVYDAMPKKLQKFCGLTKHMSSRIKKWRWIARNSSFVNGHWKIRIRDPRQYHLVQ
ncbi:putative UDP-glucuronate:xylan alpha-glucuronosyltransferase 4 isoform X2 [Pistacia vera]|uniref:putative UDP-glucuronate:xylan alpha-glucuronosyltransferase 4 isoform X2 n=1 Tax=Pistacia vera TaxID=55513 RepID=UPI001263C1A9|nr:putative UDP-glucuronate:xylan alpha-glucuronosyltransferase 4 isoform X2 [Pistacia vera]